MNWLAIASGPLGIIAGSLVLIWLEETDAPEGVLLFGFLGAWLGTTWLVWQAAW